MRKPIVFAAVTALGIGGLSLIGCGNETDHGTLTRTGGGSTDVYGTSSYDRYKLGGNVGTGGGPGGTTAAPPAAVNDRASQNLNGGRSNIGASESGNANVTGAGQGLGPVPTTRPAVENVPTTRPAVEYVPPTTRPAGTLGR